MSREEKIYLFPLILDTLIHKPLNCETETYLLTDIRVHLKNEGIIMKNLKKDFQKGIDMGKGLGIFTVQGDELRMPRLLKMEEVAAPSTRRRLRIVNRQARNRPRRRAPNRNRSQGSTGTGSRSRTRSRYRAQSRSRTGSRSNARNKRN